MIEWEAVGLVVGIRPAGDIDAIVAVVVGSRGLQSGFVRAGRSRRGRSVWEVGNRVWIRWRARDAEPFGTMSGEVIDQPLARLVDDGPGLTAVLSGCALLRDALPPGGEAPLACEGLQAMIELAGTSGSILPRCVLWEADLLSELGYGLDLGRTPGTIGTATLVSPRTGRAVTACEAGDWRDRLLPLPPFMRDGGSLDAADPSEIEQGLRLTGHFLAREVFAHRNRSLPPERQRLLAFVERLASRTNEDRNRPEPGAI